MICINLRLDGDAPKAARYAIKLLLSITSIGMLK
jgi:hypothetical protein